MECDQGVNHTTLKLSGALLVDGFSVYLVEIAYKGENYYYVGMTGDGHYRSARAGFYRLAGHLEYQNKRSTQNQLLNGLMKITKSDTRNELNGRISEAQILFHHFALDGFKYNETRKLAKQDEAYRRQRRKVLDLEKALIHDLRMMLGERLLNETKGKRPSEVTHSEIHKKIIELVK